MTCINFRSRRETLTRYQLTDSWQRDLREWFNANRDHYGWSRIIVFTDTTTKKLFWEMLEETVAPLNCAMVPVVIVPGEDSKDFSNLRGLIDVLVAHRVHRRELLLILGGGTCCDMGGLLALLYMRGMNYAILPTSLMAQIDAAIGGKVGADFGVRKNLLGGFHHPLLVLVDPAFLRTLPENEIRDALAEAVKLAIISGDESLLELLAHDAQALLNGRYDVMNFLERCIQAKLDLLADDPYEDNLDRVLNLGHAVAHALERLPIMRDDRLPTHGEAVSIGLAATIRYAFRTGYCAAERAALLLRTLANLHLPLSPGVVHASVFQRALDCIIDHRGGAMRLVVPATKGGAIILPQVDVALLVECLLPVSGLPL